MQDVMMCLANKTTLQAPQNAYHCTANERGAVQHDPGW